MARRTNHPLKTLFMLALTALAGWGAYEFIYVRGFLKAEPSEINIQETRERVRSGILDAFAKDLCLITVDEIAYRANEDHFRVRVTLSHECSDTAREMCEEIANAITDDVDESVGVFAYDQAGNLLGKFIE